MRKLGFVTLLGVAALGIGIGCGGGGSSTDALVLPVDAGEGPDASGPDAEVRGNVADFGDCNVDSDCMNPNSDCRPIGILSGSPRECIPRCDVSTDCPFSTFCWPTGGGAFGPTAALMGDHCWFSLCGEAFGPMGTPRSVTGGSCNLGEEAGVPPTDQFPGYCLSISDQFFGQCLEAGTVAAGGVCDFSEQTRGGANCDGTTLCIGQQGAAQGTCAQVCDPTRILTGEATGCTMAGETCFDSSNILTYNDGSTNRQTIAFCTDVVACGLIGPNVCPNDMMGMAQGCAPTNALRPTGICDPSGTGGLAAGAACPTPMMGTPDSMQCTAGTICNSTCQTVCKTPRAACTSDAECAPAERCMGMSCQLPYADGPDVDCTTINPAFTCQGLLWDGGFDNMTGTPDDNITHDWGSCR